MEDAVKMQPSLFEVSTPVTYIFITNRMNLLTILDAGFVRIAELSWRYSPDSRELYGGRIPLIRGLAPEELQPIWEGDNQDFPVALEFTHQLREWIPNITCSDGQQPNQLFLVDGLVPLKYLKRIVFRKTSEREDYIFRSLGDKPFGEEFFSTAEPDYIGWHRGNTDACSVDTEALGQAASRLGAVISMLNFYEFSSSSVELLASLVDAVASEGDDRLKSLCRKGMLMTHAENANGVKALADRWLLKTVFDYCTQLVGPEMFTQDRLIDVIRKKSEDLGADVRHDIEEWLRQISQIFDSEADVPPLPDHGSIVRRAILLLALRETPARFEALSSSSLQPGSRVKLLAACFLGALCGHQNLSSPLRKDAELYFSFIASVLERLMGRSKTALLGTRILESVGMMARYELLYQGRVVGEWSSEPDPVLAQVYYQALGANYPLHYDHQRQCLRARVDLPGGRKQEVYISRGKPSVGGDIVLHFYSPCLDLKAKGRKMLKDQLYDLLRRNSEPGMHCRFAIDETMQAVTVAVDHIQNKMDEKELIAHLKHVASTADSYEKETLGTEIL